MSKEVKVVSNDVKDLAFPEITKLQMEDSFNKLVAIMPEHQQMLDVIKESTPEIHRSTSLFFKTQSQFMDNMMTVSHNTPLRNLRQILAEMNQTREAIKEAYFKLKKKDIEVKQKQLEAEEFFKFIEDPKPFLKIKKFKDVSAREAELKLQMLEIEIQELIAQAETTRGYISGAIRKLTNYTEQYNTVQERHGLQGFTEADFELEEERYHIMKAFEQALCAARTRHDFSIDEGNMIYLTQIGINGAHAQFEIHQYLKAEQEILKSGKAPTHDMYLAFLNQMATHFAGSAQNYANAKGMATMTTTALIQKGDDRFLLTQKEEDKN